MDRNSLKADFSLDQIPHWPCPSCGKGYLCLEKKSFFRKELAASRDHSHEAWDPDWIQIVYSCFFYCTNSHCEEVVASTGIGKVVWPEFGGNEQFSPKYFEPPLKLILIPDQCPETVSIPIEESFRLFFCSPDACANSLRVALEHLLTALGIKRYNNANGKRHHIKLHGRIELIPVKYSEVKELMLAIKWLGNAGSHSQKTVSRDDVIFAYEMLEYILQEIYMQKTEKLKTKAQKINKMKGPVKRI
jgi:hypothetical protein